MVNSRESLAKIPSMNNDANPYIVTLDIYKEGYWAYDISNYYKGRVDDNGTPFMVRWFEHGQLKNVQGLRPFIRGTVGQHTIDDQTDPDNPKVVPSPDCSQIDQTGETTDTAPGGIAIYRMVNACFTQEGMFYGEIGLKNSSGLVLSSVDIAFKVLGGSMNMLGARKFYVSEFEKALDNLNEIIENTKKDFSQELKQVIDDARNAYESETKNAHDSLDALKSQIQANRDEQENLAQHLAGTEQQIETHDVITRPEFFNLSNQLTQQVSQMKEAGLEFFSNADDLKAKYPQGANKLCVTLNDSHEWVYDYANGQWSDAGTYNYGTIDPKLQNGFYRKNTDNLIPNPDFDTLDGWKIWNTNGTASNFTIREGIKYHGSNIARIIGYWDNAHPDKSYTWLLSPIFPVNAAKTLAYGAMIDFNSLIPNSGGEAQIQLKLYDVNGKETAYDVIDLYSSKSQEMKRIFREGISPANSVQAQLVFGIQGGGYLDIAMPTVNEGNKVSYSVGELDTSIRKAAQNLLLTKPVDQWMADENASNYVTKDTSVLWNGYATTHLSSLFSPVSNYPHIQSGRVKLASSTWYKVKIPAKVNVDYTNPNNSAVLTIWQFDKNGTRSSQDFMLENSDQVYERTTYFKSIENIDYAIFLVSIHGSASVNIGNNITVQKYTLANRLTLAPNDLTFTQLSRASKVNLSQTNNIINDTNSWITIRSSIFPVPEGTKVCSFTIKAKADIPQGGSADLTVYEYDDKNTNPIATNNFHIQESTNLITNEFDDFPLDANTKYIQIAVGSNNCTNISFKNIDINYDISAKITKFARNIKNTYDVLTGNPFYTWNMSVDSVVIDKNNLYNSHPIVSIKTQNKTLQDYTGIFSDSLKVTDQKYLNYQVVYKGTGRLIFTIRQLDKTGKIIETSDFHLFSIDDWRTFSIKNYKLSQTCANIKFIANIQENGTFEIAEVKSLDQLQNDEVRENNASLPEFKIQADSLTINSEWSSAPFEYIDDDQSITGYIQYAVQGNSSSQYPKKNLKIKLFKDENCKTKLKIKPKADWTANNKFNLKANWIDATQSRNLVNAQMVKKAYENTPIANADVAKALTNTQSMGQMEGLPIELSFNDGYYGLMTFNTKKDDKTFGMDNDNPDHECVTNQNSENGFKPNQGFNSVTDYWTEIHDNPSETLKTNMANMINFINTSSDTDFKAKIGDYIDVYSVINTYLYGLLSEEWDFQNKSQLLLTWNGGKYFFMIPYDLDSTWGLYWNGSHIDTDSESAYFDFKENSRYASMNGINNLMARIIKLFKPEIKAQWLKLRSSVWRNDQIIGAFKKYINSIPEEAYEREQEKWPDIPSKDITDFAQIQQSIIARGNAMDSFMENLGSDTKPATTDTTDTTAK